VSPVQFQRRESGEHAIRRESELIIQAKAELERMREQIQNVE